MKISIIIVLLSLMVRDVFSVRGLNMAEVEILPEGQVPADAEDEITCTMAAIEPAGSDVKFVKYIASDEEAMCKSGNWRDNDTASTFEKCAEAAAASGSKMFLFDSERCRITDDLYDQTDLCSKIHSQMVYVDNMATVDADTATKVFCNYELKVICEDGRRVNTLTHLEDDCSGSTGALTSFEGQYHLMTSKDEVTLSTHSAECAKYGAQLCGPEDDLRNNEFISHLDELRGESGDFVLPLNTQDGGATFQWSTGGVAFPNEHNTWNGGKNPNNGGECVVFKADAMYQENCADSYRVCCMIPHYAD